MDVLEAIKTRRSIRKYKPAPVDDSTLRLVLDAARLAPSWANTQCWRFIVIRDSNTKSAIADTLTPGNRGADALRQAPIAIIACAELGRAGYLRGEASSDKGDWYMFDVALAMANLTLAAHSLGLGTVHIGAFDAKKVASILGVPQGYCVVEMTPLGYPEFQPEARPRKELSEIVFYEKFGQGEVRS